MSSSFTSFSGYDRSAIMDYYLTPMILEQSKLNCAPMDIFSRLMFDRILFIGGEINEDMANIINAQLLYLSMKDKEADISIYINSPGGCCSDGLSIYDTMQLVKPEIVTVCTGRACSMASLLLAAGTQGKRKILPHSKVMLHQPSSGIDFAQETDISIFAKEIAKTKETLYQLYSKHTGKSIEQIHDDLERDYYLTAKEAKDYGLVDIVL